MCDCVQARVGRPFFLLVQGRDFTHKPNVLQKLDKTRKTQQLVSYDSFKR